MFPGCSRNGVFPLRGIRAVISPARKGKSIQVCVSVTRLLAGFIVASVASVLALAESSTVKVPLAKVVPERLVKHGHVRIDNYNWLRERKNSEVLAYLAAENEYFEALTAHTKALEEKLFQEIKGRIKETDISVPVRRGRYVYFTRTQEGKQYPIHCRREVGDDSVEQVMLDVNEVAEGHQFCSVRVGEVSSGENILPYAVDTVGRRFYSIHFKDLGSGNTPPDVIPSVTSNMAWASDNQTLFYTKQHPQTLRSYRVYRHQLGTDPSHDQLVYEETDETFSLSVFKTRSKKYVMIRAWQTLSTEFRYLDATRPEGEFIVFWPRERDHEYSVDHLGDRFYIRTNRHAKNFRLMSTPVNDTREEVWEEVVPHRPDIFLEGFVPFTNHLTLQERREGLSHVRIRHWSSEEGHDLDFGEEAYEVFLSSNPEMDTDVVRYRYTSLTTPMSVYDYNMVTRERTLLKQTEVLGGFDSAHYKTERLHAKARDGARIPVSLVYRRNLRRPGKNPLLLYGYGSYGASTPPFFRAGHLSLLDRGFVYAIAHIRGGQELGRAWYEAGKLLKKKNTFTDFIDVAEFLIEDGYADSRKVYAMGGSAGGLLMGAIINMRSDLFHGVITRVPFVDIVTSMLDESIPLTTAEYDEWGNPNERVYYDYMLSYSPYDNVSAQGYPNLLVTAGLHDSQVQYWEPAKWVAKLRASKTTQTRLLFKIQMEAGHGGPTGRYHRYREIATWWTFLLDLEGISN